MSKADLVRIYIHALAVETKQAHEFKATGQWHCDCACQECQILEQWQALSWWQRLRAKRAY